MNIEQFFEILVKEMENNEEVRWYHRLFQDPRYFEIRKAYFCQRLNYLIKHVSSTNYKIWDCGCGYGTTALFLAMNGYMVHGTTIGDHYYNGILKRFDYWSKYGNCSLFTVSCESLFDAPQPPSSFGTVIIQDTLHHLEPLQEALNILHTALKPGGKLIVLEANGNNLFHKLNLFRIRGNKRIIEIYDEYLKKNVMYGNENYRSFSSWEKELIKQNLKIDNNVEYIKFFLPNLYNGKNTKDIINLEQLIAQKYSFLREFFFFGLNFVAKKTDSQNNLRSPSWRQVEQILL